MYCRLLLIFALFGTLRRTQGLRQSAVSLNIPSNVAVKSIGWQKIKNWQAPEESGHVITGTVLSGVSKSDVYIPRSGLYAVFVTVSLTGADIGGRFKASLVINDGINNSPNGLSASKKGGPSGPKSLTIQGVISLQLADYISVYVYSETDNDWSITGQSETTFSMEFVDVLGDVPGFLASLKSSSVVATTGWKYLREWRVSNSPGLFISKTGFSKHIGEFVPICEGIYLIAANLHIKTNASAYFELGIAVDSVINSTVVKTMSSEEFTLSISTLLHLRKGQLVSLAVRGFGTPWTASTESSFSGVFLRSYNSKTPGFSTILQNTIQGSGGGWIRIPFQSPNGSSYGQFQTDAKYISDGKYYPQTDGLYIITATIRFTADSLIQGAIFTRALSASTLNGNILGLYSRVTKTNFEEQVTLSIGGVMQLLANQLPLSFYIYMQNAGNYKLLPGSRISLSMAQARYPAFHATLNAELPQTSNNAWIEITSWQTDKVEGSFSQTNGLSTSAGRYTVDISGIYHISSNVIFNSQSSFISLLISTNGGQSKRSSLFSTKGDPAGKDTLSVSGSLRLLRGDYVSVLAKASGTSSWSVGDKSSFSIAYLGLPFSVPGFSAVLSSTKTYTTDAWHQVKGLLGIASSGQLYYYGGGLDLAECKYTVPESGLYIVNANLKLTRAMAIGSEFTANIAIDNNPGSSQYLNGLNDFVARTVSLGSQDFYSLNIAGVVKLSANQNLTLWVKSKGGGTWDISEDSSFSIALLHVNNDFQASGFQAALNPLISQSVVGATKYKLIRYWVTTRTGSANGLFNLDKYQDLGASSGTVTVRESGLYFVSAAITLKNAAGKFEIGVHLQGRLAGLYSLVDSSKLDRYTMKSFGILNIGASHTLSIRVQAPSKQNWEQDVLYCGLSFVKIAPFVVPSTLSAGILPQQQLLLERRNWTRIIKWATGETAAQYLSGSGFSKTSGIFTVPRNGIFIVSTYLVTETTDKSPTVNLRIAVNPDLSNAFTPIINTGLSTLNLNCNKSCMLHVTGVMSLRKSDKLAVYTQSNDTNSLQIRNFSMFSIIFISESLPLPNGMLGQLSSELLVKVKGNKQVTGWKINPASGSFFGSTGNMDSFYVQATGIYFVSINIKFKNLHGFAKAFTSLVNIPAITAVHKENTGNQFVLTVSGCMKITSGSYYTVTVYSETDSDYLILPDSIKSAVFLGTVANVIGFTAAQSETKTISIPANTDYYVHSWSILGKDWLFESGTGFLDRKSFIVPQSGIYYLSSHIIISTTVNTSSVLLSLGMEKDGFLRKENELQTGVELSGAVKTTLVLAGSVYLEKWSQVNLVMRSSATISVQINIDSTFSIVKLNQDLSLHRCTDNGPRIIGHLNPDELRTSYKKSVSWQCKAIGPSVTYGWMKNYATIPGQSLSTYSINSAQVSDTGEYVCTATYDGIRVSSNIAKLTVFDPIPVFLNPAVEYNLNASENGPTTIGLLNVLVRGRSLGNAYAQMKFEIISGNTNGTFSLSTTKSDTGFILIRNFALDRETIPYYSIVVQATNLEAYSVTTQRINITVTDQNDNSPIFTQKIYRTSIYENTTVGTTVIRVIATDKDIGENSRIKYWFIPSLAKNVFAIDPNTGYVTLEGPIDRETRDLYVIFVKAYDPVFSVYSELSIQILDVNEHAPVFDPDKYAINVSETVLPGSSLVSIHATDNDTGNNADLMFNITSGDPLGLFRITKYGTIQNQRKLDYEKNTSFSLTVSVRDNGQPPLYANKTASVWIYITDANDNSPTFDKDNYVINVYENTTIGENICFVHAKDLDAPGQLESMVSYSLEGSPELASMFILNSTTGAVTLNASLDFETVSSYRFTVIARDAGVPSLKDKAQVTINIIDVNDNRPEFAVSKFVVNVTESSQINRDIFKVVATDKDSGLNAVLRYSLVSGDTGNTFTIDPITGNVIAMKSLDHERDPQYNLVIACKDMGNPQLASKKSLSLKVNVLDENDNSPRFNRKDYTANVQEDLAIGSTILFVNITDPDAGINGIFNVTILEKSAREVFEYNPKTCALALKKKLDYEKVALYQFTVIAKDLGTPSLEKSAVIAIKVENVNDNAPKFKQSVYSSKLPDMVFENFTVYRMIAEDPDVGPSGRITYEILSGNPDGQFRIGTYTGIVETAKNLNTTFITSFSLEIIAKDGYQPPKVSNRTRLDVHVTKTPSISSSGLKAGTTSLEANIDVKGFAHLNIKTYQIIVQEYRPDNGNFNMLSSLPPVTWYDVNKKEATAMMELRRFIALSVSAVKANRRRRAISNDDKIAVIIGTEKGCDVYSGTENICNGPLKAGKAYRLQVRGYSANSNFPRDSHFTVPIKLGELSPTVAALTDLGMKDGTLGLAVAFVFSTILVIILLGCHINYKRRHEIIYKGHLARAVDLNLVKKFSDESAPGAVKTGFGPLSDISVWPQMSMAEVSHMFQRSQGGPAEKYVKIPSTGDSGINHAFDDDDSWRLNLSDENDESWEDSRRTETRVQNRAQASHEEIRVNVSQDGILRISDNNGSSSSLETNAEGYQPPKLSDSLRGIFKSEENKEDRQDGKALVEMSIISEESENEIETEFGPELETSLGPDADQSSIDEEL